MKSFYCLLSLDQKFGETGAGCNYSICISTVIMKATHACWYVTSSRRLRFCVTFIHLLIHSCFIHSTFIESFTDSFRPPASTCSHSWMYFTRITIHLFICWFVRLFIHSVNHSFIHSLTPIQTPTASVMCSLPCSLVPLLAHSLIFIFFLSAGRSSAPTASTLPFPLCRSQWWLYSPVPDGSWPSLRCCFLAVRFDKETIICDPGEETLLRKVVKLRISLCVQLTTGLLLPSKVSVGKKKNWHTLVLVM